ncbi:MAG: hypothetical protein HY690_09170 [Chloroflexi bacterium]|nr:hypothetical protein [Chloroflexota bacterium]
MATKARQRRRFGLAAAPWPELRADNAPVERLLAAFEAQAATVAEALAADRHLAEAASDPAARLVLQLVLEDEARDQRLLERMAAGLRGALEWATSPRTLPAPPAPGEPAAAEWLAATRARLEAQQVGARRLRQLARQQRQLDDGLFALLLEAMALESQKHARMLRFLVRRLER